MSRQPTHHGYAVNVKDHGVYNLERGPLSNNEVQVIYESVQEQFWFDAASVAHEHGFRTVYAEGRMGGWAVPQPQPATDDMWEHEVEAWVCDRFRPFEAAILELMTEAGSDFERALAEAIASAAREPTERAYWAARDVVTL